MPILLEVNPFMTDAEHNIQSSSRASVIS